MATVPQTVPQNMLRPLVLPFGYDLAPPRQSYITFVPAVLVLTGILSWVMGDELGMVLAATVASVLGLYTLWNWVFRKAPTRFSTLLAMALLLGYGVGTLNTWITLPRGSLSIAELMGLPEGMLARGMGAVLISSATLFFLGEIYERPLFGREFRVYIDQRTRILIRVGMLGMLGGYITHSLSLGGPSTGGGHVSIAGLFLTWLYTPLTAISVAAFLTAERRQDRIIDGLTALILLMMFSVLGRRVAIYTSVEVLFMLRLIGFRWQGSLVRKVLLILGLGTIAVACSLTFMLLRMAGSTQPKTVMPVEKRLEVASNMVQKGGAYAMAAHVTQVNLQTRTFILSFFAYVLDSSSRMTPALGQDTLGMLQLSVPSVLYPGKNPYFSEEALVDQQFHLAYGDQPNSILTAGATDFGLVGVILFPPLIVFLSKSVFNLIARWFRPIPLLIVALSFILMMVVTESTLNGYFEVIRNSCIFGALLQLFVSMPGIRLKA